MRWFVVLWLPAVVAVTFAAGLGYGIGQYLLRSGANDPQTQVAQDAARSISAGADPQSVVTGPVVDLATSSALEVTVVDRAGAVLASTGRLDSVPVLPPIGALRASSPDHPNAVTWQPRADIRMAAVIATYRGPSGSGSVVAARSLRVVEQHE